MYRTHGAWHTGIAGARTVQDCTGVDRSGQEYSKSTEKTACHKKTYIYIFYNKVKALHIYKSWCFLCIMTESLFMKYLGFVIFMNKSQNSLISSPA